ncbi:MAG: amidohydrolase family protein, partial [Chloroflexi bacterium]|nr:amidohydrolase family protein [Chloroflexota bacterium]
HSPTPPAGVPGLETALPLLLTAVHNGRVSLRKVVRLTSVGPAVIYGLSRKGRIAPGHDADLTLVDPDVEWIIGERPLFTRCGWSPFEGDKVEGRVEQVFLRGQEVYAHGEVLAQPGYGRIVVTSRSL